MLITEMKGASLLPVRKEFIVANPNYPNHVGSKHNPYHEGFNSAVTQLEQCSVHGDIEEFAKELYEVFESLQGAMSVWSKTTEGTKQFYRDRATELLECKQNWLVLERCK